MGQQTAMLHPISTMLQTVYILKTCVFPYQSIFIFYKGMYAPLVCLLVVSQKLLFINFIPYFYQSTPPNDHSHKTDSYRNQRSNSGSQQSSLTKHSPNMVVHNHNFKILIRLQNLRSPSVVIEILFSLKILLKCVFPPRIFVYQTNRQAALKKVCFVCCLFYFDNLRNS